MTKSKDNDETEETQEFNVLNHELVPIHELLPDAEAKALLENLNIVPEQLPKILAADPAARATGAKAGQILRIRRKSRTAGEATAFRLVIEYQV
jgi:DNA-directed RNA polymerase subunit H